MKKILALVAVVCLVVPMALFANGSGEVENEGPVTLQVWSWLAGDHDNGPETYGEIFRRFEEANPDIKIEFTDMPYPSFWDSWRNATIAGVGPDVVSMYGGCTAGGYSRALTPLQDIADPELIADLKFIDAASSPNGNLYLLPTGAYSYCLMLNNNLIKQAGLDPKTAFSTWDNMLDSMGALREAGITPFSVGWSDGYALEAFIYTFIAQLLDAEQYDQWIAGKLPITDPVFAHAFECFEELNEAGAFTPETLGKKYYYDGFEEMAAGKAAAVIVGGIFYPNEGEKINGEGSISLVPFPAIPGSQFDKVAEAGASAGWSVTSWTKHKEAALKLVEFMASPEAQLILWENTELVPNNKSLTVKADTRLFNEYLDITNIPENRTVFSSFTDASLAVFQREASNLVAHRTTAAAIMEEADKAHQKALKEMFK